MLLNPATLKFRFVVCDTAGKAYSKLNLMTF